jgi:Transposase DDE domain
MPILPSSRHFDQSTLSHLFDIDPVVQRYRSFFALFTWSVVQEPVMQPSQPGKRPHPQRAYVKALLLKINEGFAHCTQVRRFLVEHPLLVLELGFRPVLDCTQPYGFDVERTVPTARWFSEQQRTLAQSVLQSLLLATVGDLCEAIPGLGETVAFDVTHIYAYVQENNPRAYVKERYHKDQQPKGDRDCKLGVKRSTNKEQADGSTKEEKEYLWGYGSGVASATIPGYGDVVVAEYTQPFNENDITYFVPLYLRTVATLGFFPTHLTADAAFDAWYTYQMVVYRGGIAAIPLNQHGHPESQRDRDGVPLCAKGLRMHPTYQFSHTYGYCSQRFRCPLLFPMPTGQSCDHPQFLKEKGCVKDLNWELGGQMRVTLDRQSPLYKAIYHQRTSTERINSQSKALGIKRPKVRNLHSVRTLNTLTYLVINARALQRARQINACLLTTQLKKVA